MKILVPDFDDISLDNPDANGLQYAFYLKGKFPKLKLTFFIIPARSTHAWMREINNIPWIKLAMHGYHHDENEEITQEMLDEMWPFTRLYKGPNWKITNSELALLERNNWKLAVKDKLPTAIKQWSLTDPRVIHGHCWIKSDWERLESLIEHDTEFKFIEEIV